MSLFQPSGLESRYLGDKQDAASISILNTPRTRVAQRLKRRTTASMIAACGKTRRSVNLFPRWLIRYALPVQSADDISAAGCTYFRGS
ncbi:MAG: hypothetical protein L0Z07_02640 [Planctomycetes bacterium]|nr:hypothetical protein [Planctomycetota bacterium]